MSSSLDQLKQEAAKLSDTERAELALVLLRSLEPTSDDPDIEQAWLAESERRLDQIERGEATLIPGDEVFARIRQRLG